MERTGGGNSGRTIDEVLCHSSRSRISEGGAAYCLSEDNSGRWSRRRIGDEQIENVLKSAGGRVYLLSVDGHCIAGYRDSSSVSLSCSSDKLDSCNAVGAGADVGGNKLQPHVYSGDQTGLNTRGDDERSVPFLEGHSDGFIWALTPHAIQIRELIGPYDPTILCECRFNNRRSSRSNDWKSVTLFIRNRIGALTGNSWIDHRKSEGVIIQNVTVVSGIDVLTHWRWVVKNYRGGGSNNLSNRYFTSQKGFLWVGANIYVDQRWVVSDNTQTRPISWDIWKDKSVVLTSDGSLNGAKEHDLINQCICDD